MRTTKLPALAAAALLTTANGLTIEPDSGSEPAGPSSERVTVHPIRSGGEVPAGYVEYLPPGYGDVDDATFYLTGISCGAVGRRGTTSPPTATR